MNHETYLSTKQQTTEEKTWIPNSDADTFRPGGTESTAEKRSQETGGLNSGKFPKSVRLRRRREFLRVYGNGVRVSGRHIVLFVLKNTVGHARLGITASKKTGNAVRRARARRRIREIFRTLEMTEFEMDLVVNVRGSCADAEWDELRTDFVKAIEKSKRRFDVGEERGKTR